MSPMSFSRMARAAIITDASTLSAHGVSVMTSWMLSFIAPSL